MKYEAEILDEIKTFHKREEFEIRKMQSYILSIKSKKDLHEK